MGKIAKEVVAQWRAQAVAWCEPHGVHPDEVYLGKDAWSIAARSGVLREAYTDEAVTDGHVQTALEKIFPNARFNDKKTY